MRRRHLLLGGGAAIAMSTIGKAAHADLPRRITLRHAHTGAKFEGIWHSGHAPDPNAMAELSAVLTDSPELPPHPFDPDVIEIVWEVAQRARLQDVLIVRSGYRTPAVNRAVHGAGDSQHLRAGALDIEVASGRMSAAATAALRLARGGVGVYSRRGFIHLDSGPVRHWSDQTSGARMSVSPQEDRIARMAEAWRRAR